LGNAARFGTTWKPLSAQPSAVPVHRPVPPSSFKSKITEPPRAAAKPPTAPAVPPKAEVAPTAPAVPAAAPEAVPRAPAIEPTSGRKSGNPKGRIAWRQRSILAVFAREQRDLTNNELDAFIRVDEPAMGARSVNNTTFTMVIAGHLVRVRQRVDTAGARNVVWTLATRAARSRSSCGRATAGGTASPG
jgi:hypothetical protein